MISDKDLKINRVYWAEIIDPELKNFVGQQVKVKFTGVLFRNMKYRTKDIHDFANYTETNVRAEIMDTKQDAILFLDQIKIFKEASEE